MRNAEFHVACMDVIDAMKKMTEEERTTLISELKDHFCLACGIELTDRWPICHCENDE